MPQPNFTVSEICELAIAVYEQFRYWLKRADQAKNDSEKKLAELKYTECKALLTKLTLMVGMKPDESQTRFLNLQKPN
jgi:hypothetical protein